MNKTKRLLRKTVPQYLFVCILGIILHFSYAWSNQNPIISLFSAVNESTWEHLKLLFFPMLFLTLWEVFYIKNISDHFLPSRTIGILAGMFSIIILFYTLSGLFGTLPGYINIAIYFISVALSFATENHFYKNAIFIHENISWSILFVLVILFFVFTFYPPNIELFISPI